MIKSFVMLLFTFCMSAAWAGQVTVKDVLGRDVTFNAPAERVVVGFYPEDYMAIGTEAAYDKVVGMSKYIWQARPANWDMYVKHRPSLNDIPGIGRVDTQTFSVEKVISLNPDVLMLADWQYKGLGTDIQRIEDAGIKVVVVDFNAQTLERHIKSTELIGIITGQEKRAAEIAADYKSTVDSIRKRLAEANLPEPKVYTEFGASGVQELGFTFGKNMWGAISTMAGGDNISAPFVEWWGKLNPEQVIASNPDVVVITGYETGATPNSMIIGQDVDSSVVRQRLEGYKERLGWSSISAVKNNRMFAAYHGACRTIMDSAMIEFYAKAMYPKLFADLEPEKDYINFYKKYLPVTPKGTFMYSLQD